MKKSNYQNSDKTPINQTLNFGAQLIIGCAAAITITILFIPSPLLEILSTFAAIFVATFCLFQIFQEYNELMDKESHITESLIKQIHQHYEHPPKRELITTEIHNLLNKYPSHDTRLKALNHFQDNPQALDALVLNLQNIQRDIDVIDELGLSWSPNNNRRPTNLEA